MGSAVVEGMEVHWVRIYHKLLKRPLLAGMAALMLLTGCSKGLPISSDIKEIEAYSLPETMIIVATERNRYTAVYTDQVWNVGIGNNGMDFQTYILGEVRKFVEEMKTMNLLAEEKEVTLTSVEQDQVTKLAQKFFQGLTPADIAYMGITEEDVKNLYREYRIANKLVDELTRHVDLEVSDNEAKIIKIAQIKLENSETAQSVWEEVNAEGADFDSIARDKTVASEIERQLGKGEESSVYETAAFNLAEGQISEIIESGGSYYIIKCLDDYDEKATQEHKKKISADRKNQAFYQVYNQFLAENKISFSDKIWAEIQFSPDDDTQTTNFFELYRQVFPD